MPPHEGDAILVFDQEKKKWVEQVVEEIREYTYDFEADDEADDEDE